MRPDSNTVIIRDADEHCFLRFEKPERVFETYDVKQVIPLLREIEYAALNGCHAVGFVAYEAAAAFDPSFAVFPSGKLPLLWFGIYRKAQQVKLEPPDRTAQYDWQMSVGKDEYDQKIRRIKEYLRNGDTYQINYTCRLYSHLNEDFYSLFRRINQAQNCDYGAFITTEKWAVASASPELFFSRRGNKIVSRPMKGTAPRGMTLKDDLLQREQLQNSEKDRAENLMIVDMVRNDLGRVAENGSIEVRDMFKAEKYPTLWQLTTTVEAQSNASIADIFTATFPAASITGAPKTAAMHIINELECSPRGVYCGSIGMIRPGGDAQFNVAIRTIELDRTNSQMCYGVGGGIVWDSDADSEFTECRTKALVLSRQMQSFSLLETILWQPGTGFYLLNEHLQRLYQSAQYFDFSCNIDVIAQKLHLLTSGFKGDTRLRLLLDCHGKTDIEYCKLQKLPDPWKICLAPAPVDSSDVFLYHKTSNRKVYDDALDFARNNGCNDVLLHNHHGELTESSIANIALKIDGKLLTPPLSSGLLNGICRSDLLKQGKITESVLTLDDLQCCSEIWLFNSVRRMWPGTLKTL